LLPRPGHGIRSGHVVLSNAQVRQPIGIWRPLEAGVAPSEFWLAKTCRNATISTIMKKEIRLNAFAMNCVAHQSPGLWTHPRDRTTEYNRLPYWIDLAQTLERGRFDGLFLADVLGVYDVFGGGPEAALRNAAQTPANDPLLVIPAMAAVTKNLGFGVTSNLSYEYLCPADVDARPPH
jgi:hypothetical protein